MVFSHIDQHHYFSTIQTCPIKSGIPYVNDIIVNIEQRLAKV